MIVLTNKCQHVIGFHDGGGQSLGVLIDLLLSLRPSLNCRRMLRIRFLSFVFNCYFIFVYPCLSTRYVLPQAKRSTQAETVGRIVQGWVVIEEGALDGPVLEVVDLWRSRAAPRSGLHAHHLRRLSLPALPDASGPLPELTALRLQEWRHMPQLAAFTTLQASRFATSTLHCCCPADSCTCGQTDLSHLRPAPWLCKLN